MVCRSVKDAVSGWRDPPAPRRDRSEPRAQIAKGVNFDPLTSEPFQERRVPRQVCSANRAALLSRRQQQNR
jgi:hypothetical protein